MCLAPIFRSDFQSLFEFTGIRLDSKNGQTADDKNGAGAWVCPSRTCFRLRGGPALADCFLRRSDINSYCINDLSNPFSDAVTRPNLDFAIFTASDLHRIVNAPFLVRRRSAPLWSQLRAGNLGEYSKSNSTDKMLNYTALLGGPSMMRSGHRYRCQNRECAAEIEVTKDSMEGRPNPRCFCGAEMKMPYTKPILKTLDKNPAILADILRSRG